MELCNPRVVRELLEKYGLAPKKGYGQNFLINPDIPARIAGSSALGADCGYGGGEPCADENVCALEIGPGIGVMTRELSELYSDVCAVEIDTGLIPLLSETLEDCPNVTVVNQDFMKLDLPEFLRERFGEKPVRVCANLPYYITSPILMAILEGFRPSQKPQVQSVTVLVQAEVADRLCAAAGSSEYGSITAAVALAGKAKKLFTVAPGCFYPAPKVTSAVVQITLYENGARDAFPFLPEDDEACDKFIAKVKKTINAAFGMRRKTLTNALGSLYPKSEVEAALTALGMRADIRGEKLSCEDFVNLVRELEAAK